MQLEKREIHTVFLRFPNFYLSQNLSPSTLADLISGYFWGGLFRISGKYGSDLNLDWRTVIAKAAAFIWDLRFGCGI